MDIAKELVEIIKTSKKEVKVIAIDGRAASGKTTLAKELSRLLGAGVIHTDDFFLPLELRSEERLKMAGGNIHHERFCLEVLPHLRREEAFFYTPFDCSRMAPGEKIEVERGGLRIVEGSYSHHPAFGDYADIKIFMTIDQKLQLDRIFRRNGREKAELFEKRWIPMEEKYFSRYKIDSLSDILICDNKRLTLIN